MKVCLFILLLSLVAKLSFCQWEQLDEPKQQFSVNPITFNDSLLLISTSCGIHYSFNQGSSWNLLSLPEFSNAAIFKDTLYLNSGHQVYRNGETVLKKSLTGFPWVTVGLYTSDSKLYASSKEFGFSYSSNGRDWYNQSSGLPTAYEGPNIVYLPGPLTGNSNYFFAGTSVGIYRKAKSSSLWEDINNGLVMDYAVMDMWCNDSVLIISSGYVLGKKIYKSTDNGDSWQLKYTFTDGYINDIQNINDTIYAATSYNGLYASYDLGETWNSVNTGATKNINSISKLNGEVYIGTDTGIFKGITPFQNINSNIVCSTIRGLANTDTCIIAYGYEKIYTSKDAGNSWKDVTSGLNLDHISSVINFQNTIIVTGTDPCGVFKSTNNGDTWQQISTLSYNGDGYDLISNNELILAEEGERIYRSTNGGSSWAYISPPQSMLECNDITGAAFLGSQIFLSFCGKGDLLKTINSGAPWNFSNSGIENSYIEGLASANGILFAWGESQLYRSLDQGLTWNACGNGLPYPAGQIHDIVSYNGNIFANTNEAVFFSNDDGENWNYITGNYPVSYYGRKDLLVYNDFIYIGNSYFGIWRRAIQDLPIYINEPLLKDQTTIFPNPANDIITIKLQLQNNSFDGASITILNIMGIPVFQKEVSFINGSLTQ